MKVSETLAIREFYYNAKKIPIYKNLQDKTVTPNNSTQSITADDGYDGLGAVTVLPQTGGSEDRIDDYTNLIPSNYSGTKSGVTVDFISQAEDSQVVDYRSFDLTVSGDRYGSYSLRFDPTPYRGKTLEFGCRALEFDNGATDSNFRVAVFKDWDDSYKTSITPSTRNNSTVGNPSGICVKYTVGEDDTWMGVTFTSMNAPLDSVVRVRGLYLICIDEVINDTNVDGGLVIISHILPNGTQELVMYGNSDEYGYTADSTEVSGGQNLVLTGEEEEGIDIDALVNARVEAILQELEDGYY